MKWRKDKPRNTDPSWIFSTWPIPEWFDGEPTIRVEPSGSDDSERIQKAIDRLSAVSGRLVMIGGKFYTRDAFWNRLSPDMSYTIVGNHFIRI